MLGTDDVDKDNTDLKPPPAYGGGSAPISPRFTKSPWANSR